uniref:Membrane-spanning 4-domains subfamily A member 4A-like n=1 Tax=Lates calcarifer TaxID=8187 RepID=A0A4W6DVI9_LATCA
MILGTIQIIIGLMTLLFGIVMAINANTLGVFSGFFVWGALIYIAAGSLTVAAGKSLNRCRVIAALVLCVIAAVAACIATILYSLDASGILYFPCYDYNHDYSWHNSCYTYKSRTHGFSGVFVVFHLLALIVSITVAAFCCSATCNCGEQAPSYVLVTADTSVTSQAPPSAPLYTDRQPHPEESRDPTLAPPPPYTAVVN